MPGVHVPICETCNSTLNRTIEEPAKSIVRSLPRSDEADWPSLEPADCKSLAWWFLKVILLQAHPESREDNPRHDRQTRVRFAEMPPEWIGWLASATPPPAAFSVWASRRPPDSETSPPSDGRTIALPATVSVGSRTLRFVARTVGLGLLDVTIVWHPERGIDHPLVAEGRAVRLWPDPLGADLGALTPVRESEFHFVQSGAFTYSNDEWSRICVEPFTTATHPINDLLAQFRTFGGKGSDRPERGRA